LNTADLGKLSKNVLDHSNLDNLLRNSFVQTNSTDKVTLNANTLGSSLTNGDATALAASLRTASGNNDTSNYKTVTDWSGLQSVWFFQLKSLKQADSCAKRDRHGCDDACSCVF